MHCAREVARDGRRRTATRGARDAAVGGACTRVDLRSRRRREGRARRDESGGG